MDAVKEFYENNAMNDEIIVKILTSFGKFGTPVIFMMFAAIYWITGISKYFLL